VPLGAVTVGMGLKWNEVYEYLNPRNVTVAGGRVTGVGVGGFTLGGGLSQDSYIYYRLMSCSGYSWQANRVGMTVDTILKFEIVLTSGEVKTVTATSDPSLFWALKMSSSFAALSSDAYRLARRWQ